MLEKTVLQHGYCIGCGACAALEPDAYGMQLNSRGLWEACRKPNSRSLRPAHLVCPFAASAIPSRDIASALYPGAPYEDEFIGRYESLWSGHIADKALRASRTSGGLTQWLLQELFRTNAIDYVVHVVPRNGRFVYTIASTAQACTTSAKSAYYPVEMSAVLADVYEQPGRYAVVASQSFCTALRLLSRQDNVFAERIAYCLGIISAHQKSAHYADLLQWQLSDSSKPEQIDFRVKHRGRPANIYDVSVAGARAAVTTLLGTNWATGYLHAKVDDYCHDVFVETADIAIGDAWLQPEKRSSKGANIVIVRHPFFQTLIEQGIASDALVLRSCSPTEIHHSQEANIRHRRQGLAVRVARKEQVGTWHPPLQIPLSVSHVSPQEQQKYLRREDINEQSFQAFQMAQPKRSVWTFFLGIHNATWRYARCLPLKQCCIVMGHMYVAIALYSFKKAWK